MMKKILMTLTIVAAISLSAFAVMTQKDLVVYRGAGTWEAEYSTLTGFGDGGTADTALSGFGNTGATPLVGDINGDGIADVVVAQVSGGGFQWVAAHSVDDGSGKGLLSSATTSAVNPFGTVAGSDGNLLGDIDGDGIQDIITINSGFNWYTQISTASGIGGTQQGPAQFGLAGDQPICGDFDGDGTDDQGVFRLPAANIYWKGSVGGVMGAGALGPIGQIGGGTDDSLIICNLNDDGFDDAVMVRQTGAGLIQWWGLINTTNAAGVHGYLNYGTPGMTTTSFGLDGTDTPMMFDVNGDGMDDVVINRGGNVWYTTYTTAGGALGTNGAGDDNTTFGTAGDTPLFGQLRLAMDADPNCVWTAGAGNWMTASNWDQDNIANASYAIAHLTNNTSGDITLNAGATVSELNVDTAHNITGSGTLTLLTPGTIDVAASITEEIATTVLASNGIVKAGAGTLAITTATDNYCSGNIDVDAGTLSLETPLTSGGGWLQVDGGATLNVSSTVNVEDWGQLQVGFAGSGTSTANINNGGKVECYTARMGFNSGTPILNINSGGEVVCANLRIEGGTPTSGKVNIDGGTLSDSAVAYTDTNWIHSMSGVTIKILSGGATFNIDNQYRAVNQVITGTASGDLTKEGSETLALEVAPTFDGDIIVNDGKVLFNCDVSGMAGSVTVASGAEVGGSGTLASLTVPSGSTVSPGNSIGTLSTSGNLTLDTGSSYDWEVDLNNADLLSVGGTLVIGGAMTVNVIDAGSPDGSELTLASASSINGNADDITMSYGAGVGGPTHPTDDGSGNLVAAIIPEPGIIGLISLLGLAILRRK